MILETESFSVLSEVILDLKGALACLRASVLGLDFSVEKEALLFKIDEALSWNRDRPLHSFLFLVTRLKETAEAYGCASLDGPLGDVQDFLKELVWRIKSNISW